MHFGARKPQLESLSATRKIPHAATKTWHSQIDKYLNKQTRKRDQICSYQRQRLGEGENWMKVVKMYKLPDIR